MAKEKRIEIKDGVDISWTEQLQQCQAISSREMDPELACGSTSRLGAALGSRLLTSVVKQIVFIGVLFTAFTVNSIGLINAKI